jgi:hypothetical protein
VVGQGGMNNGTMQAPPQPHCLALHHACCVVRALPGRAHRAICCCASTALPVWVLEAHLPEGQCCNVLPVHQDAPASQVDQPEQRHQQSCLSAACAPHDADLQGNSPGQTQASASAEHAVGPVLLALAVQEFVYKHVHSLQGAPLSPPLLPRTFSQLFTWKLTCLSARGAPGK